MGAARNLLCRPVPAAVALVGVLFVLSFGMSTGGYLSTDTGAKVATLAVMDQEGTARPVVGYWAESFDPDGNLHPIYDSRPSRGNWVNVTTLPMLELARPLWALGGYRAALLLPILGAVGTAFACRALARRAAGDAAGWQAFWIAGLASPITVYALDLWEHAPGVACMVGAIALLVGIVDGAEATAWRAFGAGALLGVAASMRTEAFAYAFVAVAVTCIALVLAQRRWLVPIRTGALAIVGFAIPWFANAALEAWLGGNARGTRLGSAASTGVERWGDRAEEAIMTLFAVRARSVGEILVQGGLAAGIIAGALIADRKGDRRLGVILLAGSAILQLAALSGGLGFVPGMLAAAPVVVAALVLRPEGRGSQAALVIAAVALPIVLAFQYTGGAAPQWAGRYLLPSCMVFVALGVAGLQRASASVRRVLLGLSVGVTVTGLLWLSERSHEIDRLFDDLVDRPEDVIVSTNGFFVREGGDRYVDRLWLNALTLDDLEDAAGVIEQAGFDSFAVLDEGAESVEQIGDARHTGDSQAEIFGVTLYLHSYEL